MPGGESRRIDCRARRPPRTRRCARRACAAACGRRRDRARGPRPGAGRRGPRGRSAGRSARARGPESRCPRPAISTRTRPSRASSMPTRIRTGSREYLRAFSSRFRNTSPSSAASPRTRTDCWFASATESRPRWWRVRSSSTCSASSDCRSTLVRRSAAREPSSARAAARTWATVLSRRSRSSPMRPMNSLRCSGASSWRPSVSRPSRKDESGVFSSWVTASRNARCDWLSRISITILDRQPDEPDEHQQEEERAQHEAARDRGA